MFDADTARTGCGSFAHGYISLNQDRRTSAHWCACLALRRPASSSSPRTAGGPGGATERGKPVNESARIAAELEENALKFDAIRAANLAALRSNWSVEAAITYFQWFGSEERPLLLLDLYRKYLRKRIDGGTTFWRLAVSQWSHFDRIPQARYAALFNRYREQWSPEFMRDADRALYGALSKRKIRVYRGQDALARVGMCWTLDPGVAEKFAIGHRGIFNRVPVVLTRFVTRSEIAFTVATRNEREIVTFNMDAGTDPQSGAYRFLEPRSGFNDSHEVARRSWRGEG